MLDQEVEPTPARVTKEHVAEALHALQIEDKFGMSSDLADEPQGAILVALVKHLARNGFYQAVALPESSFLSDATQPDGNVRPRRPGTIG